MMLMPKVRAEFAALPGVDSHSPAVSGSLEQATKVDGITGQKKD
jgi:hypothetical protein